MFRTSQNVTLAGAYEIPGIYAAGDCIAKQLRQVVTACSDGALAANSVIKALKQ